jgi:hypothetical protein
MRGGVQAFRGAFAVACVVLIGSVLVIFVVLIGRDTGIRRAG